MIYTLTCNPSLDYIVRTESFHIGGLNRTTYEHILAGGKGINVSIVLHNLGLDTTALGFTAGFTGLEIERLLRDQGIKTDFVHIDHGFSRINVKLKSGEETEINGQGPAIEKKDISALFEKLDTLTPGDFLVMSGSIPASMPDDIYEQIMLHLQGRGISFVVDATRDLMTASLAHHPFLVKPNHIELGEIYGVTLGTRREVIPYAQKLQSQGARNVLVSMAGEGAVLICEDGSILEEDAPQGTPVNSVGAGDSMVAGFLTGFLRSQGDQLTALRYGLSAGSASAFSENLASAKEVEDILASFLPLGS